MAKEIIYFVFIICFSACSQKKTKDEITSNKVVTVYNAVKENSEEKNDRNFFSYNWSNDSTAFKGRCLYPLEDSKESVLESQKKNTFLELEIGDTLVVVSNKKELFDNRLYYFKDKFHIKDFYKGFYIVFDDELPAGVYAFNERDSFSYQLKSIDREELILTYGRIRSDYPVADKFRNGTNIETMFKAYHIPAMNNLTKFKYIVFIPTCMIGQAWYSKYNIKINYDGMSSSIIILKLSDGLINEIVFTVIGCGTIVSNINMGDFYSSALGDI